MTRFRYVPLHYGSSIFSVLVSNDPPITTRSSRQMQWKSWWIDASPRPRSCSKLQDPIVQRADKNSGHGILLYPIIHSSTHLPSSSPPPSSSASSASSASSSFHWSTHRRMVTRFPSCCNRPRRSPRFTSSHLGETMHLQWRTLLLGPNGEGFKSAWWMCVIYCVLGLCLGDYAPCDVFVRLCLDIPNFCCLATFCMT